LTGTESDAKRALLLVGTDNGTLFALDPDSHEEVWRYETEGRLRTTPAVVDNVVYIVNSRDQVLALDLGSGAWRWQYEQEMPTTGFTIYGQAGVSIVERAGGVEESATLYTCFGNGKVVALSATSGEALWLASVAPDTGGEFIDCDTTPVLDPDRNTLYVAGHETGLFALAMDDGSQRWRYAARGVGALGRGRGGDIVATSSLEGLLVVDLQGQLVWRAQVDPGVLSVPILVDGTLYATHSESGLLAFDAASGEYLARIDLGSGMSSIPVYDEPTATFYAISNRGMLLGMKIQRGTPRLGLRGDGASSM
jgi:outer membrane protein assembly factor BamB